MSTGHVSRPGRQSDVWFGAMPYPVRVIATISSALVAGLLTPMLAMVAIGVIGADDFLFVMGLSLRAGVATWAAAVAVFLFCYFVGHGCVRAMLRPHRFE